MSHGPWQARCSALNGVLQRRPVATIASYCTGAYLLPEAGLLDSRLATTHWARSADFARRYPRTELRAHEILTEQDRVLCGGAVTSFLNLAVHLVEICAGRELAAITANAMLIDFFKHKTGLSPRECLRRFAWVTGARPGMARRRRNRLIYMINIDECFSTLNFASSSRK